MIMETEPVCSPQSPAGPIDMERISQGIQILPEQTLDTIAKGPLVKFTITCDDVEKTTRVYASLLQTFGSASISHNHTTAACNALSAFLDAAFISQCHGTRQLARSKETLVTVFDTFLTRFKDVKPRPMKQVLESVAVILAKSRHEPDRAAIHTEVANAVLPSIILGEPRSRLKASIIAIETLLRKNAVEAIEFISLVDAWLLQNSERWPVVLQEECRLSSIDVSQFLQRPSAAPDAHHLTTAAEILILGFLNRSKATDLAASSGEVMAMFFKKLNPPADSTTPSIGDKTKLALVWVKPVRTFLMQNLEILEKLSNYILQRLFMISTDGFRCFIEELPLSSLLSGDMNSSSSDELTLLFASLQVGKKIGLVHEDHYFSRSQTGSAQNDGVLVLKSEFIGQFLFHHDFSIKMAALSLLTTAPSTTKPVSSTAIRVIIKSLPSLHAESDPGTRGEILSLIRGLIVRLKGGILASKEDPIERKASANKKQPAVYARDDLETRACLEDYLNFLLADLRTTASYHRHIMALKTIVLLLDSGLDERYSGVISNKPEHRQVRWRFHMKIFGPRLMRLLVDLLLDPYDEVRATALSLLKLFPKPVLFSNSRGPVSEHVNQTPELISALKKAEHWASNTSRADHADTVARLYYVLFYSADLANPRDTNWWDTKLGVLERVLKKLEDKLSSSEGLFNSSLRDAPLHGYLCALRYIVSSPNFYSLVSAEGSSESDNWKLIHSRISALCDKIWIEVKPQLCIDSPEGHAAEPIEDLKVGPKDILSYSWRALRESSLLLHATLANGTYGPEGESGLTRDDFESIGRSSFTQLAELRHRGAFSTVAQTFATCCQRCGQSNNAEISVLPLLWYQEAKKIIFETASKLTRRSAGLPALIAGILLSNPGGPLFQQVIRELQDVAHAPAKQDACNQSVELPQVHAMNCLREIFNNARLGPHAESFIMPALNLSAQRIGSPIWALRNAGLMLFRALMNRMCRNDFHGFGGKSGSEPGARISFPKYPGLVDLLSNLLAPAQKTNETGQADAMVTERVFPALELIAEKIPNSADTDDAMLLALIREHLKSPVWGIREHAARVYASLLDRSNILADVQTLINARDADTENYLHGESLCIRYSLRRYAFTPSAFWNEHLGEVKSTIEKISASSYPAARSPFVITTLLEMLSDATEKSIESRSEDEMLQLLDHIFDTYHISEDLNSVLDCSNPSWNTLSTTRAFSLLRRQLSWIFTLRKLIKGEMAELQPFLHKVATLDPNACQWILEKMQETFGTAELYREPLVFLYSSIILGDLPLEVKTPAVSNLASSLQALLRSQNPAFYALDLPLGGLVGQTRIGSTKQGFNRDRADADLQLEGCLMALKALSPHQEVLDREIPEWATRIRFALSEETEFTTRYAAATSIAAFARVLRPSGASTRVDPMFLEIYLSLYDLLNDDDEELRDIGATTASWVLSYSSVSPQKTITLSPMNASELFATFIADNYADSPLLCTRALHYVLGQESRTGDSTGKADLLAVSAIVAELRKESTILFEEEKQNLFIEEVREVDIWSRVLSQLTQASYDEHTLDKVFSWVSNGLTCLSDILVSEDGEDGLIGWTAKPETYTIAARVISLAGVFVSKKFSASGILGDRQILLREKLQTLLGRGKAALLHDDLVSRIQVALEDP
ncbi:putative death-receptor fusion protein-domain-containing protein [Aspergillus egyptiacus]|nr:putative death-receptor fusion protein-domain-containing protein [Aspergillus egyptiacus]